MSISRDLRRDELKEFSIDIEDISKTIYEQIKICSDCNKSYLYEQLGRLHCIYYEYLEESLFFHMMYVDTGRTMYFDKFMNLYTNMINDIMNIEKDIMRVV